MNFLSNMKYGLQAIVTPSCWLRNHKTDSDWDRQVNAELNHPIFMNRDEYTVDLNGKTIWVANHPYASVRDYSTGVSSTHGRTEKMPSRRTVFRFFDLLPGY